MKASVLLPACLWTTVVVAKTVTFDWTATWMTANPDGQLEREVIGINGEWPLPIVEVDKGDRVIVNLYNGLGDEDTSLHFHGLFMNGTNHMDGPVFVTQCPVPPGANFTYDFNVDQPGNYWYHSHNKGQYPDGFRGAFIVHDPDDPHKDLYDEEIVLTLSDWYHDRMKVLIPEFMSYTNPTGAEPVPKAALFNDTQNITVSVQPGKTYLFRIINMAAFAAQYFWFEDHEMQVVAVDGVYTDPMKAEMVYITAAQRVSVLVTMKNTTNANFPFVGSMDEDLFDTVPTTLNPNVTGWLEYTPTAPKPTPSDVAEFNPLDDYLLKPVDDTRLFPTPNQNISLTLKMDNLIDGKNYAFFNDITYVRPKVPTLFTALSTNSTAFDPAVYGVDTNAQVLKHMDVVDIVVNNDDGGKHPFHLHGHDFQLVLRSEDDAGFFDPATANFSKVPAVPMRRDVVLTPPNGYILIRFRADNPGVWLFHCHLEWHLISGLVATMIEAPDVLQKTITLPPDHVAVCKDQNIPLAGNAAGNTKDLLDLSGANEAPKELPPGFTVRGIVALVFSIISAFLGMGVVTLYGLKEAK